MFVILSILEVQDPNANSGLGSLASSFRYRAGHLQTAIQPVPGH
jgi:hypothetical protein